MAVLYWYTRGKGATILPDGTEYAKDDEGRVDVPQELVEEFKSLGYTDSPPTTQEPATEPSAPPTDAFGNG
jgi:hypothetical protein